jgi:hypothetical protein
VALIGKPAGKADLRQGKFATTEPRLCPVDAVRLSPGMRGKAGRMPESPAKMALRQAALASEFGD